MTPIARHALGKLDPKRTLFLCCDVQEGFKAAIHGMDGVISTSKYLVDASRILNIPCIATEQYPKGLGKTVPEVGLGTDIPTFAKTKFSMWTTEVQEHVQKDLGITEKTGVAALIFGIETHVCVQQTALDLLEEGFDVHIVVDGVSSQQENDRAVGLQRMAAAGAFLTTAESALFMLMKDAKYEHFKQVSNLTKERTNPFPLSYL